MDLGEEKRVHEVKPRQNPYKGDEVKREKKKSPAPKRKKVTPKRKKEKVGA